MSNGQGHDTIYSRCGGKLGLPVGSVQVVQGDTDDIAYGTGTGACRSIIVGGPPLSARPTGDRGGDGTGRWLVEAVKTVNSLTGVTASLAPTNRWHFRRSFASRRDDARDRFMPQDFTYPSAHCCEVEVDPETGSVEIDRYIMVHDCGTPVNPMLVEAQLQGGVVHGPARRSLNISSMIMTAARCCPDRSSTMACREPTTRRRRHSSAVAACQP